MADADPTKLPSAELGAMRAAFERLHAASRRDAPADLDLRRDRLERLKIMVRKRADQFAAAIADDFGTRARIETELMELVPTLSAVDHAVRNVARWMRPEKRKSASTFSPAEPSSSTSRSASSASSHRGTTR